MDMTEVRQDQGQPPDIAADEAALRAWDWMQALHDDERAVPWLARRTSKAQRTVYGYSRGELTPPLSWLREAAAALGWTPPAAEDVA